MPIVQRHAARRDRERNAGRRDAARRSAARRHASSTSASAAPNDRLGYIDPAPLLRTQRSAHRPGPPPSNGSAAARTRRPRAARGPSSHRRRSPPGRPGSASAWLLAGAAGLRLRRRRRVGAWDDRSTSKSSPSDPEAMAGFYERAFGWTVNKADIPGDTPYWLITTGDDAEVGINGGMGQGPAPPFPGTTTTMGVEDLDAAVAGVEAAGGSRAHGADGDPGRRLARVRRRPRGPRVRAAPAVGLSRRGSNRRHQPRRRGSSRPAG